MTDEMQHLLIRAEEAARRFAALAQTADWNADIRAAVCRAFGAWCRTNAELFRLLSEDLRSIRRSTDGVARAN